MAAADTEEIAEVPCERDDALRQAGAAVGPLRDPDGCVLACPDCTCRRLLEQRRDALARASALPEERSAATG